MKIRLELRPLIYMVLKSIYIHGGKATPKEIHEILENRFGLGRISDGSLYNALMQLVYMEILEKKDNAFYLTEEGKKEFERLDSFFRRIVCL
jgi:DNA-binding PadR family transcriptional regulator